MGSKLTEMKGKSQEGIGKLDEARGEGADALDKAQRMSEIARSMPEDVDDEITRAIEAVKEASRSDATEFMESVSDKVGEGRDVVNESNDLGNTQIEKNNEVINNFKQMDGIGDFGSGSRSEGVSSAQASINAFTEAINENNNKLNETETEVESQKSTISGLF